MKGYPSNYVLGGQSKGPSSTPSIDRTFFSCSLEFRSVYYYPLPGNYFKMYRCQDTQF